jgi:uncharacterized membrane protein
MKELLISAWSLIKQLTVFYPEKLEQMRLVDVILSFFIFSFVGWFFESLYCSLGQMKPINRGFLYGPMCPIYGTGALVIGVLLTRFYDKAWLVVILGMVACDIVEYITSYLMEKLFNARWWDYTGYFLNINGRICLKHTLIWGLASYCYIYIVQPFHLNWYTKIPELWRNIAFVVVLIIFLIDLFFTVKAALDVRKVFNTINKIKTAVTSMRASLKESAEETGSKINGKINDQAADAVSFVTNTIHEIEATKTNLEHTFSTHKLVRPSTEQAKYASYNRLRQNGKEKLEELKITLNELLTELSTEGEEMM